MYFYSIAVLLFNYSLLLLLRISMYLLITLNLIPINYDFILYHLL